MDLVELRWEALQCHLRACRSADPGTVVALNAKGRELTAVADRLQRAVVETC